MQGARRSHRETAGGAGGLFRRGSPESGGGAGLSSTRTGVNRLASWDQLSGQTIQQQLAEVLDKVWLQQREHDELTNAVRALQQQQLEGSTTAADTFTAVDVEAQVNACLAAVQSTLDAHIAEGLRQQQDQLHHALKLVVGLPPGSAGQVDQRVEPGSIENRVCDMLLESSRQSSRIDGVVAQVRLLQERLDTMQGSQEHVMKVIDRIAGIHSRKDTDNNSINRMGSPREDGISDLSHLLKELKDERGAVLDMMDGLRTHKLEVIAMLHTFQMDKQEALKDLEAIWHAVRTDLAHVEVIKGELGGAHYKDDSMDATNGVPERKARVGSISPERRPQATSSGLVTKGGGLTVPAPTSAAVMQPHNYSPKAVPRGHSMQYLEGAAKSQQNLRLRPGGVQRFPSAGCLSARDVTQVTAPPDLSPAAGLRRTSTRPAGSNVADFAPSPGAGAGPMSAPQSAMASSPQRCGACQVSRMSSTALVSGAANQSIGSATVLTSPTHGLSQQSPLVVHSSAALGTSCASVSRMSSAQQQGSMLTQASANSPQQASTQQCPVVSRMSSSSVHLGQLATNAGMLSQTLTMRGGW
mmetsp:Transcript_34470/g.78655  ORF Transcript_34470/g.78655 Transcript_34470/m.78655 type:complete len:583 (-) Transcript_34470:97-1845(-)